MSFLMSMERNIISSKTQCNAENARVNGMWQLGFSDFEKIVKCIHDADKMDSGIKLVLHLRRQI